MSCMYMLFIIDIKNQFLIKIDFLDTRINIHYNIPLYLNSIQPTYTYIIPVTLTHISKYTSFNHCFQQSQKIDELTI